MLGSGTPAARAPLAFREFLRDPRFCVLFEGAFLVLAWNRLAAPLLVAASVIMWGLMAVATGLVPLSAIMIVAGMSFLAPQSLRTLLGCCGLSRVLE